MHLCICVNYGPCFYSMSICRQELNNDFEEFFFSLLPKLSDKIPFLYH